MSKDGYNSQDELNANHYSGSKSFNNSEKSTSGKLAKFVVLPLIKLENIFLFRIENDD